jgi:hypothetical protein
MSESLVVKSGAWYEPAEGHERPRLVVYGLSGFGGRNWKGEADAGARS